MNIIRTKTDSNPRRGSQINACLHGILRAGLGLGAWLGIARLSAQSLDHTAPLPQGIDWSLGMQDGAHRFIERIIAEAPARRASTWQRDTSSPQAYEASVAPQRNRLRSLLGVVDPRVHPVAMERFGDDDNPAQAGSFDGGSIWQVRWTVLPGFQAEGLLLEPLEKNLRGHLILLPDAAETPESYAGLDTDSPRAKTLRAWVAGGFQVLIPTLLDRGRRWSGNPELATKHPAVPATLDQSHREWIWRQAFHMGRHPIGYEVQEVSAAVDWIRQRFGTNSPVAVAGYGEGGAVALYAAACDPRISATLVSGYFTDRQGLWSEPIDRNVWSLLKEFGDAELVSLVAPRPVLVEHASFPLVTGEKGGVSTPEASVVRKEFERIESLIPKDFQKRRLLTGPDGGTVSMPLTDSLSTLAHTLGHTGVAPAAVSASPTHHRKSFDVQNSMRRLVHGLGAVIQQRVRQSELERDNHFLGALLPDRMKHSRAGGLSRTHRVDPHRR